MNLIPEKIKGDVGVEVSVSFEKESIVLVCVAVVCVALILKIIKQIG